MPYPAVACTYREIADDPYNKNAITAHRILEHRLYVYGLSALFIEDFLAAKKGEREHRSSVLPPNTLVGVSGHHCDLKDVLEAVEADRLRSPPPPHS